jgi:DNA polymerase-3 subunit gamma/tau
MKLHEKHRPKTWPDVVGQDKAVATIDRLRKSGLTGRAYFLSGPSGTGKTTFARLIAGECAKPFYVQEMDGSKLTAATLDDWETLLRYRPLEGKAWVFIINECHLLPPRIIGRLLVRIDDLIKESEVWIFTTTATAQKQLFDARLDASAFLSRCVQLKLTASPQECAEYVQRVAVAEDLDGAPLAAYEHLAAEKRCNLRDMIQAVENGDMLTDQDDSGADCFASRALAGNC